MNIAEYAEHAGIENLKERIEVAAVIQRESNTAVTLFLSGAGASLAYAAHIAETNTSFAVGTLVASAYLFFLAGLLARECLGLIAYPATWNEPRNLNRAEYTLEEIRGWELENIQARIDQAVAINEQRSKWLNRCRLAAAFTPAIAVLAWAVAQ